MNTYYVEVGTINGATTFKVRAHSVKSALKIAKAHLTKIGRAPKAGEMIKVANIHNGEIVTLCVK